MNTWGRVLGIHARPVRKGRMRKFSYEWLANLRKIVIDSERCPLIFAEFVNKENLRDRDGNWLDEIPDGYDHRECVATPRRAPQGRHGFLGGIFFTFHLFTFTCACDGLLAMNDDESYKIVTVFFDKDGNELAPVGVAPVFDTGCAFPTFGIVKPAVTNTLVDMSPYGQSVFAGAVDAVQAVDHTFDALVNEIAVSKMRVFLSDVLKGRGRGKIEGDQRG